MNQLKAIRVSRGFTQTQIAEKVGITLRSYQRYEAGERTPDVYIGQQIAKAVGSTVDKIFVIQPVT
ncbi:MAG: helix-turn-helix transcriptional regulator [Selenomonas sp.]|nr:helix-turn-helix transcriptional regulator [Selenomonas sp.]